MPAFAPADNAPAGNAAAVTKSDATVFAPPARGLYVGGAGDVAVTTVGGDVVTFVGVLAGTVLPVYVTKVMATNTSATSIVRLW